MAEFTAILVYFSSYECL